MKNTFTCIMRDTLQPVMESQGFAVAAASEDGWILNKKEADSGKTEIVYVDHFFHPEGIKRIRLLLSVIPCSDGNFLDLSGVDMGDRHLKKSMLEGWEYETEEDAKEIIDMITRFMITQGFEMMNAAQQDEKILSATLEEQRDLYENHDKYKETFRLKHNLKDWNPEMVFQAVNADLKKFPPIIGPEDRQKILPIAAACGEIFVEKGGEWRWENTERGPKACAVIPNRNISIFKDYTMVPLDLIYVYINTEFRENICVWISGVLKQSCNS